MASCSVSAIQEGCSSMGRYLCPPSVSRRSRNLQISRILLAPELSS